MTTRTDLLDPPLKQALNRGRRTLEAVLRNAGAAKVSHLQTSTNEVAFLMEVARLAVDTLGLPSEKKLHEARLRGLRQMAELRTQAGPCLETGEVCSLLGVSRETVRKKVDRRQILAIPKGGDRVFPAFQFKDGDVIPQFHEVLQSLGEIAPFVALSFLLSANPSFGGKTALELLHAGNAAPVISEARAFLNHGS